MAKKKQEREVSSHQYLPYSRDRERRERRVSDGVITGGIGRSSPAARRDGAFAGAGRDAGRTDGAVVSAKRRDGRLVWKGMDGSIDLSPAPLVNCSLLFLPR
jgi:hypothetical protein